MNLACPKSIPQGSSARVLTRSALIATVLALVACGGDKPAPAAQAPAAQLAAPAAPSPHAAQSPAATAAPDGPASAGGLQWDDVAPLVRRAPKSSMRAAEYGLSGDDKLELTVFYFGPDQGGSVEANVARWLGQITQPDGSDTAQKAVRGVRQLGGIDVSLLEVAGNYAGMAMPGAAPQPAMDNALMLAAIATGPQGPVFFKLLGPRDAVEHSRAAFDQMIGSLRAK